MKRLKNITAAVVNLFKESTRRGNNCEYNFSEVVECLKGGSRFKPKSRYVRLLNKVLPTKKELRTVLNELVKLDYLILKKGNADGVNPDAMESMKQAAIQSSTLYKYNTNRKTTKSKSS